MTDTIAAIATPMIPSAIGILRLSGPGAAAAVDRVFTPFHGGPMSQIGRASCRERVSCAV